MGSRVIESRPLSRVQTPRPGQPPVNLKNEIGFGRVIQPAKQSSVQLMRMARNARANGNIEEYNRIMQTKDNLNANTPNHSYLEGETLVVPPFEQEQATKTPLPTSQSGFVEELKSNKESNLQKSECNTQISTEKLVTTPDTYSWSDGESEFKITYATNNEAEAKILRAKELKDFMLGTFETKPKRKKMKK